MPENSNITKTDFIDAICAAVGEGLLDEVRFGMEGLDNFLTAVSVDCVTEILLISIRNTVCCNRTLEMLGHDKSQETVYLFHTQNHAYQNYQFVEFLARKGCHFKKCS